jgi:hypothetical protein
MTLFSAMMCLLCGARYDLQNLDGLREEITAGGPPGTPPTTHPAVKCRECGQLLLLGFEGRWHPLLVDFLE